MYVRTIAAALIVAALTGCTGEPPPRPSPTAGASGVASPAPVECGTFTLGLGGRLSEATLTCFVGSIRQGRAAQLQYTETTDEGDPVHRTYLADAAGRVEETIDWRQDRFHRPNVERSVCSGPETGKGQQLEFRHCSEPVEIAR